MNETLKVIAKRYSCRDYKKEMPSEEVLQAIGQAAIQSPSARNRQPWQVIIVKDNELIKDLQSEGMNQLSKLSDKTMYNNIMERGGKLFYGAPCMVIIAIDPNHDKYSWIDCGILCQNVALAATSMGLGNVICGLTGLAFTDQQKSEKFSERLGFPKGYIFGCSVLLGHVNASREPHIPDQNKITII
ncbi:MAG TPA: nitroreductase [Anaerovoracaceae bacterium]|nr:nitroreductase [Anaerovoracaceae bacterium]